MGRLGIVTGVLLWALLVACGSSDSDRQAGLTLSFSIFKNGENVNCADVPEIDEVEVTLLTADGLTPRVGYPKPADCASGTFEASADPGDYTLEVTALGALAGEARAPLFRSRSPISLPRDANLDLSLRPEVAYLEVTWVFGQEALAPCGTEVSTVDILVGTGAGVDSYQGSFGCTDTPVQIPRPFPLLQYNIQIDALSTDDIPLFSSTTRRLLDRGANTYEATLAPLGGRVFLDWRFAIGSQISRMCDDARVGVEQIRATMRSLEGSPPVSETIPCDVSRPYAFRPARFTQGRLLEIDLVAEGEERFRGIQQLTMPEGDWCCEVLTMDAVGTATVSFRVDTATCADVNVDRYDLTITNDESEVVVLEDEIPLPRMSAVAQDLPYGDYQVELVQRDGDDELCSVDGLRSIDARENDWDVFIF